MTRDAAGKATHYRDFNDDVVKPFRMANNGKPFCPSELMVPASVKGADREKKIASVDRRRSKMARADASSQKKKSAERKELRASEEGAQALATTAEKSAAVRGAEAFLDENLKPRRYVLRLEDHGH